MPSKAHSSQFLFRFHVLSLPLDSCQMNSDRGNGGDENFQCQLSSSFYQHKCRCVSGYRQRQCFFFVTLECFFTVESDQIGHLISMGPM